MFSGFSERTSAFFWDISFNNERAWFHEHKDEFETVINRPLKELTKDIAELMRDEYPQYDFQSHVSRIYRDARRLFGRGPLKDNLWSDFYRAGAAKDEPSFWFGIHAVYYCWGMGVYDCSAEMMSRYRKAIEANPARFERIILELTGDRKFILSGEDYKRPKGDMGSLLNPWYNKKNLAVRYQQDFGAELFRTDLPQVIFADFQKMMPLYQWFLELFGNADGPGAEWGIQ